MDVRSSRAGSRTRRCCAGRWRCRPSSGRTSRRRRSRHTSGRRSRAGRSSPGACTPHYAIHNLPVLTGYYLNCLQIRPRRAAQPRPAVHRAAGVLRRQAGAQGEPDHRAREQDVQGCARRAQGAWEDEEPVPERRRDVRVRAVSLRPDRVQVLYCHLWRVARYVFCVVLGGGSSC